MNIVDIITKKKNRNALSKEELSYAFLGYLNREIKDYQMSSLLMAICINGMTDQEVFDLTDIFIKSGRTRNLTDIEGIKVDKHSTGGVGDKTTLIVAPIVASLGVKVPKMSGRGLGYTGGTIDKLESIPGFETKLTEREFKKELADIGMVISSQTDDLVPMDRVIYELRDVTGTVESIPLIAVSVMSKKIATGADQILIDIKYGKGALLKTEYDAKVMRDLMIRIGKVYGKETRCILSCMDNPLGICVGNALEVAEAIAILKGKIQNNLYTLSLEIASNMVSMAKKITLKEAREQVKSVILSQEAYQKFLEFVSYQKGDLSQMRISGKKMEIMSKKSGLITAIDAHKIAQVSFELGSGRSTKEEEIDHSVGVFLNKRVGDHVQVGDILCTLYYNKKKTSLPVEDAYTIQSI